MTHEDPVQATFSDSELRINAIISKGVAQQYAEKHKERISKAPGGLFQLSNFEIVATHLGGRSRRITLFVMGLKPLGSNGSGLFGEQVPRPIEDRKEVALLLQKFKECREDGAENRARSGQQSPSSKSVLSSQDDVYSPSHINGESQPVFATQVPVSRIHPAVSKQHRIFGRDAGMQTAANTDANKGHNHSSASDSFRVTSRIEALSMNGTGFALPARTNNSLQSKYPHDTTQEELLSLLPSNRVPGNKILPSADVKDKPQPSLHEKSPIQPVKYPQIEKLKTIPNLPAPAADVQVASSLVTDMTRDANHGQQDRPISQESDQQLGTSYASITSQSRISIRDVKISKEQEALLDSKDCKLASSCRFSGNLEKFSLATCGTRSTRAIGKCSNLNSQIA